ncbi:hypothetical protein evm_006056 [Chilo suppressalis]|nr:hypothetical protein evm_006056 [Chilo suppressalis]
MPLLPLSESLSKQRSDTPSEEVIDVAYSPNDCVPLPISQTSSPIIMSQNIEEYLPNENIEPIQAETDIPVAQEILDFLGRQETLKKLGFGIIGLVNLNRELINNNNMDKMEIIKEIAGVSQILLGLHYEETVNRRKLLLPLLHKKFCMALQSSKRDTFLFGEKLAKTGKSGGKLARSSSPTGKYKSCASVSSAVRRAVYINEEDQQCSARLPCPTQQEPNQETLIEDGEQHVIIR